MEQSCFKLKIRPISVVTDEALSYIKARKDNDITSLATRWKNSICVVWEVLNRIVYTQ